MIGVTETTYPKVDMIDDTPPLLSDEEMIQIEIQQEKSMYSPQETDFYRKREITLLQRQHESESSNVSVPVIDFCCSYFDRFVSMR